MESVWEESAKQNDFKPLNKDLKTDILIIGGGLCGVLCAYMLHEAGADYVLCEADTICSGVTKNTTAKITSQHGLIYDKIIKEYDEITAKQYLCANEAALKNYRKICRNIDCDFEEKDAYVYSLDNCRKIEKEITVLKKIGFKADFAKKIPLPIKIAGAVRFKNQAQFNPLEFVYEISEKLNIFEHTRVRELIGTTAVTNRGKIKANRIIVATHFPFINKHGSYFIKMYQHRSYVIALENALQVNGMYVDEEENGMSFRNYKNYLLVGGGDHRTGKKGGNWQELRNFAKCNYPGSTEKYHYATQDCMTLDGIPYIGEYSAFTDGLYVATGFNKWGMTTSMAAAMMLSDILCGKKNPYIKAFSPSRSILHPKLASNAFEAAVSLLDPSLKRCPHLGCALKWNSYEHTWDCQCHGSRFTKSGELIDNPATKNLKNK